MTQGGRTQTIQGRAGYQDDVLVLGQEQGPPLTGKVALRPDKGSFTFKPPGAPRRRRGPDLRQGGRLIRRPAGTAARRDDFMAGLVRGHRQLAAPEPGD